MGPSPSDYSIGGPVHAVSATAHEWLREHGRREWTVQQTAAPPVLNPLPVRQQGIHTQAELGYPCCKSRHCYDKS